ncbi:hypothetical protein Tco_1163943 [Tanacetum coccineum]
MEDCEYVLCDKVYPIRATLLERMFYVTKLTVPTLLLLDVVVAGSVIRRSPELAYRQSLSVLHLLLLKCYHE